LATAVLIACIFCLGDKDNNPAPTGMNGMILLWLIVGIGAALGTQTAYCLNPARDLGPRIAAAMYGYPSSIWTYRHCYWIWTPIIACAVGGVFGGFVYDLFLYQGKDSPLNKPWGRKKIQSGNSSHHTNGEEKV
jgi:aquaglyceroporin related protein